ncbi:unnamed protein product [Leuciscus chuanchicus]
MAIDGKAMDNLKAPEAYQYLHSNKVENAVRQGKTGRACTDGQNQWNAGSKRNAGQRKMKYVCFKRHNRKDLYQPPPTSQPSSTTPEPAQEVTLLRTHEEWRKNALASPMAELFNCPGNSLLQLCFNANTSSITEPTPCPHLHLLTHDEHHTPLACLEEIEKVTKAQSKEQVWHDARRVRVTASTARKVPIRSTTVPDKFLSEHLHPSFRGNAATRQGAEGEELARDYLETLGNSIETKGLVVCEKEPWLAASPDGVIKTFCWRSNHL